MRKEGERWGEGRTMKELGEGKRKARDRRK